MQTWGGGKLAGTTGQDEALRSSAGLLLVGSLCNEGLAPGTPFWGMQQLAGSPVLFQVSFCPLA